MSSAVWEYFTKVSAANSANNKAKCKKCGTEVNNSKGSTSAMINHLRNIHKISCKRSHDDSVTNVASTSGNENSILQQKTSIIDFMKKASLGEIVDELATKDGFSIRAITRSNFIRHAISEKGYKLPKSENGTMALIHDEYEKKKKLYVSFFDEAKKKGEKFSITLDEWVSSRQRRYMNINVHDKTGKVLNLGLVRIIGSCNSAKIHLTVDDHLKIFHLSFERDIVATTNDGCSVMVKYGRECPAEVQLCLNHGLHLAVSNTFYCKKTKNNSDYFDNEAEDDSDNNEDDEFDKDGDGYSFFEDDDTESEVSEEINLAEILNKVRAIVKFFKNSTVRNDILQQKICIELGHELHLKLDVKHRWNSIHPMLETFLKCSKSIEEVLKELNACNLIRGIDFEVLRQLCAIIEPLLLTVLALGRKDANLITAKGAINFLLKKLNDIEVTNFLKIDELKDNIKARLCSRENIELNSLLSCLLQQKVPTKEILNFGSSFLSRLYPHHIATSADENYGESLDDLNIDGDIASLQDEINAAINKAGKEGVEKQFSSLRDEFATYKKTGKRTLTLQQLYDAILTIRPTSTESERVFSVSANFSRKLRSRLSDYSLNSLIFLKYFRINNF